MSIVSEQLFGFDVDRVWDYENGFYLTSPAVRIGKLLTQYELYKTIVGLPGVVVECGVYKGASLIRWATFREFLESAHTRRIVAFDAFGKFPVSGDSLDVEFIERFEAEGGLGIPASELARVLERKGFTNCELVEGDILETVPRYVAAHPELKIALLHIDVDVYEPTMVCLRHFYERVVRGGLIVLDDYAMVAGETAAVDDFFASRDVVIEKLVISHRSTHVRKGDKL